MNFLKNFTRKADVFHVILSRWRGVSITAGANPSRQSFITSLFGTGDPVKVQRIGILLLVLCIIGVSVVSTALIRYEKRTRARDVVNKGRYLVTLIALHSVKDFEGNKRPFFLYSI